MKNGWLFLFDVQLKIIYILSPEKFQRCKILVAYGFFTPILYVFYKDVYIVINKY